ncbi:MAG: hypothetical protein NZM04_10000 [Methylacidiphilales bacterium]|nr:hypothetical protein [Candidatus Methylacidiphilales bacterium]MDW8349155.1 hypothetical protein [Verrucomicrobiae bacterium]
MKTLTPLLLLALLPFSLHAILPSQLPKGAKLRNKNFGYIRILNAIVDPNPSISLQIIDGKKKPIPIAPSMPLLWTGNFAHLEPETYTFSLIRPESPNTPIQEVTLNIKRDEYYTILLLGRDGKYRIETINDTYDPATKQTTDVHIRNFYQDLPLIILENDKEVRRLDYGDFIEYNDVDPATFRITLKAPHPRGDLIWPIGIYETTARRFFYYAVKTDIYTLHHDLIKPNPLVEIVAEDGSIIDVSTLPEE